LFLQLSSGLSYELDSTDFVQATLNYLSSQIIEETLWVYLAQALTLHCSNSEKARDIVFRSVIFRQFLESYDKMELIKQRHFEKLLVALLDDPKIQHKLISVIPVKKYLSLWKSSPPSPTQLRIISTLNVSLKPQNLYTPQEISEWTQLLQNPPTEKTRTNQHSLLLRDTEHTLNYGEFPAMSFQNWASNNLRIFSYMNSILVCAGWAPLRAAFTLTRAKYRFFTRSKKLWVCVRSFQQASLAVTLLYVITNYNFIIQTVTAAIKVGTFTTNVNVNQQLKNDPDLASFVPVFPFENSREKGVKPFSLMKNVLCSSFLLGVTSWYCLRTRYFMFPFVVGSAATILPEVVVRRKE
jgi:hypothetical protein